MCSMQIALCIFGVVLGGSWAGTTSSYQHRTTSLDELKEIDSYVATGLPLFDHGFFVSTAQGPILVKAKEDGIKQNKPKINPGYYSTLPRLIPSGYEGISISHFNLGSAFPAQSPSIFPHPPSLDFYEGPSHQFAPQGHFGSPFASHLPRQPSPAPYAFEPRRSQTQSGHFIQHHNPQRRLDRFIDRQNQRQPHSSSQVAEDTFQVDNFINAEDDHVPTSYQNTMIAHESIDSNKFVRNPTVIQAFGFDDDLPENLKKSVSFYKNQGVATALAQESLPIEGETVVGQWDTTKIQKKRISDLLRAAGFLR